MARERRSGLAIIKSNTKEYCNSTTLHGFSYWVNNTDTKAEKGFWIVVVILGFAMASLIISSAFEGRNSSLLRDRVITKLQGGAGGLASGLG